MQSLLHTLVARARARAGHGGDDRWPPAVARAPDLAAVVEAALQQSLAATGADAARIVLRQSAAEAVIDSARGLTCAELARDDLRASGEPSLAAVDETVFDEAGPGEVAGRLVVRLDTSDGLVRGRLEVFWRGSGAAPDRTAVEELLSLRDAVRTAATRAGRATILAPSGAVDRLTGLRNRQTFEDDLAREVARAGRHGLRLALLLIDLDGFEELNRTLGRHDADAVLAEAGGSLASTVRRSDEVGRLAGNRFGVILFGSDEEGATRVFGRIRPRLREGGGLTSVRVDASGGVAAADGEDAGGLLARAAGALRAAKHARRGGVAVAPPRGEA